MGVFCLWLRLTSMTADTQVRDNAKRFELKIQILELNGHEDNLGSLPADSEQFMMIEDLYKTTDKLNAHILNQWH